ncbi:MAG: hypothetical protein JEY71_04365 [Sphaerochaeta sp.]|nr:hypothetical protein [Sphaerochaeta sp.]
MKNAGTILLSAGVMLVGFSLLTPLLFFFIGALLGKGSEGSVLQEMGYALLSLIGLVLLVVGSLVSAKFTLPMSIFSGVATLSMVVCFLASNPKTVFGWVVTGCYYFSQLVALSVGIAILHTRQA